MTVLQMVVSIDTEQKRKRYTFIRGVSNDYCQVVESI